MQLFLERFARTVENTEVVWLHVRKIYPVSVGPIAKATLESSTWKLILQQKEEGITTFAKEEGYPAFIGFNPFCSKMLCIPFFRDPIDTNGAKVVGRLVTDPYSTALYSTEKDISAFN